jgi:tetratricopeptide (TPR) repeat protein
LERARQLFQKTEYAAVLNILPEASPGAAELTLAGKSAFFLERYKDATRYLEMAVEASPGNSEAHHWLGKAFGRRAETSSFLTAPGLASKCRKSFERAVEIDPRNIEAMADLLEYYLEAPGLLGGGQDKAARMADRIHALDPAEGAFVRARLAEKAKDYAAAEKHLRAAAALEPAKAGRWIDLAKFLARQERTAESEEMFTKAESVSPGDPATWFARAEVLIAAKREPARSRRLLEQYIASDSLTPEHPTRLEAQRLLARAGK